MDRVAERIADLMTTEMNEEVSVGDLRVAFSSAGEGPAVVLIHGLAEDRSSWAPQLGALPARRTVAYDLRGHGSTTAGCGTGKLEQLGEDLVRFMETVTGPATVVGFSLGGTIALWGAAERPDLVSAAVVLGTSSVVGRAAAAFYAERIALVQEGDRDAVRRALRDDTAAAIASPGIDLDALADRRLAAIGTGEGYINAARAMQALRDEPLTPRLAEVRCHVDVVGGEHDNFCPRKAADILVDALPSATYHELTRVGHLMNADDPRAVTAKLIEATERTGTR